MSRVLQCLHVTQNTLLQIIDIAKVNLCSRRPISNESEILRELLIKFTYESVTIEVNTLTYDETKIMAQILLHDPAHDPCEIRDVMGTRKEKIEMANHLKLISKFQELSMSEVL